MQNNLTLKNEHAAVIYNNPNGKEEVILFSTNKEFDISQFKTLVSNGQSPRLSPKEILFIKEIPALSTGKTNFEQLKSLLKDKKQHDA